MEGIIKTYRKIREQIIREGLARRQPGKEFSQKIIDGLVVAYEKEERAAEERRKSGGKRAEIGKGWCGTFEVMERDRRKLI